MSDLIQEVTPLTRALVWLVPANVSPTSSNYKDVDYLLNGLLTASLEHPTEGARVIISDNFNHKLYFLMVHESINRNEVESFFNLIKSEISTESRILLIDDSNAYDQFKSHIPKHLSVHVHVMN